ncbi:MAG: hypothetical protein K0S44_254 [Bacteroidetes bacterium]|jgi:hypothetical protein|nr:hypothetical protein [Bacteroidota bacterium]
MTDYKSFLEGKIVVAEDFGFEITPEHLTEMLLPHQKDIVTWCLKGGRRAIFASFGLGKTIMQLEIAKQCIRETNKPFLICMPLGVVGEFKDDNELLKTGHQLEYITDTDELSAVENKIYVTNYERVRKGDINPESFGGVSFDEASILRSLKTETTNYVLKYFKKVKYRFVATATPTPNDFIEILNYADYLGVIDRGHALTRFFQRDSQHAGHLKLYENKKEEFWKWVSTWAVFINKPSDLGYDDAGYNLPKLNFMEIEVENISTGEIKNKKGDLVLIKDTTKSLVDVSREKSESIDLRVDKSFEIFTQKHSSENVILWSDLESERVAIERKFKNYNIKSVYGSQTNQEKEELLIGFKKGEFQILNTKAKIAGSGCNFQHHCHTMIFVGINYKFNDFIQAIHRVLRFKQLHEVSVYVIFTNNEHEVLKALKDKWRKHIELQTEMINLVREYGLNTDKIKSDMKRQIFNKRRQATVGGAQVFNEGKITVTTDVVRENNQTYRLTWGEQRKDATKMGVGLPEYILLFRKAPSSSDNAYADTPVIKKISDYLLSLWQLDAHAYWKSSGNRFLSGEELAKSDMKQVFNAWKKFDKENIYSFQEHLRVCQDLDDAGKLSKLFMTIPPISSNDLVWTDINRMNTLNANQTNQKKEKHICPLQLDIIERLIYRFTNEGEIVDDPFGGLFSTAYKALEMKRKAISAELNPDYYDDGLFYLKSIEYKISVPTLFDLEEVA